MLGFVGLSGIATEHRCVTKPESYIEAWLAVLGEVY